jgi:Ca2+-binding EF-hand superfamily protein
MAIMTRKQFMLMSTYRLLSPKGDDERFARHIFRAFDLDKSDTSDFYELLVVLSMASSTSSTKTKFEWTFHVFVDGNGLLT